MADEEFPLPRAASHIPHRLPPVACVLLLAGVLAVHALLLTLESPAAEPARFKVVVNSGVRADAVTRQELSDLFLKKVARWPAGESVLPVDQSERTNVRVTFSKEVHQRSLGELRTYWEQRQFSGRGSPPLVKASDEEVVEFVKSHPGAVGYVSGETVVDGVALLRVKD